MSFINMDVVPNVFELDATKKNANGSMFSSLIFFYLGIGAAVAVCIMPPFTLFLPIFIPIIAAIFIFVHLAYLWKFMERGVKKIDNLIKTESKAFMNARMDSVTSQLDTLRGTVRAEQEAIQGNLNYEKNKAENELKNQTSNW